MTLAGSILRPCHGLHRATAEQFFRVFVDAGTDPLTRRTIRLKSTVKTEPQARIELGRLLKDTSEDRTPESGATMAKLMDEYAAMSL